MQLGHLLTRSGLTYPEVSSKVYHDSFCQSDSSVSLPWVFYLEAFYLYVVSSFSCIPIMPVQRLNVAILSLDLPCSGPVTHSGEILSTDKSHGKKPDKFSLLFTLIHRTFLNISSTEWDLGLSQRSCWRLTSVMWHCVMGWIVAEVLKEIKFDLSLRDPSYLRHCSCAHCQYCCLAHSHSH